MSLGMTYSPTVPWGGAASYKLRPVFTYNNGYWEVYSRFQWDFFGLRVGLRGGGDVERILPWRNMSWGKRKFNEKGAGFSSIIIKKTMKNKHEKVFQLKVRSSIKN